MPLLAGPPDADFRMPPAHGEDASARLREHDLESQTAQQEGPVRDRTHTVSRTVTRRSSASGRLSESDEFESARVAKISNRRMSTSDAI